MVAAKSLEEIHLPVPLGSAPRLGLLYDARSDTFVSGQTPTSSKFKNDIETKPNTSVDSRCHWSTTREDLVEHLDISGELKLSVLVLVKASGSASYHRRTDVHRETASITISNTATSFTESLVLSKEYTTHGIPQIVRERIAKGKIAPTHIVTEVTYGHTLSLRLTSDRTTNSESNEVKGKLKASFSLKGLASIAGELTADVKGSNDTKTSKVDLQLEGQGYHIPNQPTTLEEAADLFKSITSTRDTAVPIKITMAPIASADSSTTSICYELGQQMREDLIKAYSRLRSAQAKMTGLGDDLSEWSKICFTLASQVNQFRDAMDRQINGITGRFSEHLIAARTLADDESQHNLENLLQEMHDITGSTLAIFETSQQEFTQMKGMSERLKDMSSAFCPVEEIRRGMWYPRERVLVIIKPEREAGDVLELEGLLRILRRWRKPQSESTDDISVYSIFADEVAVSSLNQIMGITTENWRSIEVFVWRQPHSGDPYRWEHIGGRWQYLVTRENAYIGDVRTTSEGNQVKHGEGQLECSSSISSGTWRDNRKHGLIRYQADKKQASTVEQLWRHGVLVGPESGALSWLKVKVVLGEETMESVISTTDSADQVIATVKEDLEFYGMLRGQPFFLRPFMVSVLDMPIIYSETVYGNNGWTLGCWGFGLPGSQSLRLQVDTQTYTTDNDVIASLTVRTQDHFAQPLWVHVKHQGPGPDVDWSCAHQTGCDEDIIESRPFAIARAELPCNPSNSPAEGLVLGKTGKHLDDGAYIRIGSKKYPSANPDRLLLRL
jgi:hypothetical protein